MTWRGLTLAGLVVGLAGCYDSSGATNTDSDTSDDTDSQTTSDKPAEPPLDSVGGRVTYQDRVYNDTGFVTGNTPDKAARRVLVDLIDASGELIATTLTDQNGRYAFLEQPPGDYQVRVLARTTAATGETISVHALDASLYAIVTDVSFDPTDTTADIDIDLDSRMAGPFNMLDAMHSGVEFYHHWSGQTTALDDLDVFWQLGQGSGTYTCAGGDRGCSLGPGIYVLSDPYKSGDTDEFDDDVLWHEFAHHIEFSLGLNDSPGGYHSLGDTRLDLRLAWSEGLANYMQTAIKAWLRKNHPGRLSIPGYLASSHYVDTRSSYALSIDLANPPAAFSYATNETAVAKVLWELQQEVGQQRLWSAYVEQLPSNAYAVTLEAYWDSLLQTQPSSRDLARWRYILAERAIEYAPDSLESDHSYADAPYRDCRYTGQTLPANCIANERHSLYHYTGQVDSDTLALDVSAGARYRIWTHDLGNGADTRIGLYRADGTSLLDSNGDALFNDDAVDCENQAGGCSPLHDGTHFSSSLEFQAEHDERIFLVIDSADAAWLTPANYGYLARYGDYAVSVDILEANQ